MDLLLVEKWSREGHLPFFKELLASSPLVRLTALSRVLQGSIWPSILTGASPGQHGRYSFSQLAPGTYHLDRVRSDLVTMPRFYTALGAHNLRCAIVDIPFDLPHDSFPGTQVVDWATEMGHWGFSTQPEGFKEHIIKRYGRHYLSDHPPTGETVADHRKLFDDLVEGVHQKTALVHELLSRHDDDLIFVVYGEPHKAGHFFWKYMDVDHPDHVATPDLGNALLEMYKLVDRELAGLVETLAADDNVLVFSDHGMQANYRGEHMLQTILERLNLGGWARPHSTREGSSQTTGRLGRAVRRGLHHTLRRVAPAAITRRLRNQFGQASQVRWDQVKAFPLPTDRNSYIRINLRDREPLGTVLRGTEYRQLLDKIEREFRALVNAETGKPAVEEVFRVQEMYRGPRSQELPDIAILWSSESPINVVESASLGRIEARAVEQRSGNHRPEGFLFARGPRFAAGARVIQGDILQIPPTLLALHDVPIPPSYEMGPLSELFASAALTPRLSPGVAS